MERKSFFTEASVNKAKSIVLFVFAIGVFILFGYVISMIYDPAFMYIFVAIALVISLVQILFSYFKGDKMILKMTNAKPAEKPKHAHLINTVEGLALAAGIPTPKVYVIENPDLNAFATGRNPEHASVAVTTGLIDKLSRSELEGVIAHELAHVKNYDILFGTLTAMIVGLVVILSHIFIRSMWFGGGRRDKGSAIILVLGILFAILAPIAIKLIQLAISRKREYLADASGAKLTRYPEGLAGALEKIKEHNQGRLKANDAVAHLFFSKPGKTSRLSELFSTHPNIEKRIEVLRSM